MDTLPHALAAAAWLGLLTSISPCPLATNIAAISFVGRRVGSPRLVFVSGLLYALGRTLAYTALAALLVGAALNQDQVAYFLQKYLNKVLGPLLIVTGVFLLELIELTFGGGGLSEKLGRRVEALGLAGAGLLGFIFALSFCPTTALLYFGSLLPLALQQHSPVLLPAVFGVATAAPVLVFAFLLAFAGEAVGRVFKGLSAWERWARRVTGVVFVGVGIYLTLIYIYGVRLPM